MKWIVLLSMLLLAGCGMVQTTELVQYRQVLVTPAYYAPVYTPMGAPLGNTIILDRRPLDVTTTTVDYY